MAFSALGYNTWRNLLTETNRDIDELFLIWRDNRAELETDEIAPARIDNAIHQMRKAVLNSLKQLE